MKILIIEKLSLFNSIIVIIFKIFGFKIYYYKLSIFLQSKKIIKILDSINIRWINFNDEKNSVCPNYGFTQNINANNSRSLSNLYSKNLWDKRLKSFFSNDIFLKIYIHNFLYRKLFYIYGICEFAKKIQKDNSKIFFWINRDEYNKAAIKNYNNFVIIKPKLASYLSIFLNFAISIIKYLISKILKQKNKNSVKNRRINKSVKYKNLRNIYFLTHGIVNTNSNYKDEKNFFFSASIKDKLNPNNFIICELFEELSNSTHLKSYKQSKLAYVIFGNLISRKIFFKDLINCFFIFVKNFTKVDLEVLHYVLLGCLKINLNFNRLSNFKYLKNALIENELLFPIELAIALKKRNITITCLQKRIYVPAISHQLIIDNYFLIGRETIRHLKNQFYKKMNLKIVGGRETYGKKDKYNSNKKKSKNFKINCAVVDYHSKKNWYESALNPLVNWADNMQFYKVILNISKKHPDILFTIKSKNYDWLKLKYFRNIKNKFINQKNIKFFNDHLKLTNYQLVKNFNFFITKYSSLTDDALMNNKPVIIYENSMFISDLVEYDKKIISKNIDDLNSKIISIKLNYNKYNNNLNILRKKFYTKFNLKNYKNLLKKIFI